MKLKSLGQNILFWFVKECCLCVVQRTGDNNMMSGGFRILCLSVDRTYQSMQLSPVDSTQAILSLATDYSKERYLIS